MVFIFQSLTMSRLVESYSSVWVTTHLWVRGYWTIEVSLFSLLYCHAIELNIVWSLSYIPLSCCLFDVISWKGWFLKAWGRKGEFWCLLWFFDLMSICEGWFGIFWCDAIYGHMWSMIYKILCGDVLLSMLRVVIVEWSPFGMIGCVWLFAMIV